MSRTSLSCSAASRSTSPPAWRACPSLPLWKFAQVFGSSELRKDFSQTLMTTGAVLVPAFCWRGLGVNLAGEASPPCCHWPPRGPNLTCSCVGGESQFPGFPAFFPGRGYRKASVVHCFVVPVSGEIKIISDFTTLVDFTYETNKEITFSQGNGFDCKIGNRVKQGRQKTEKTWA